MLTLFTFAIATASGQTSTLKIRLFEEGKGLSFTDGWAQVDWLCAIADSDSQRVEWTSQTGLKDGFSSFQDLRPGCQMVTTATPCPRFYQQLELHVKITNYHRHELKRRKFATAVFPRYPASKERLEVKFFEDEDEALRHAASELETLFQDCEGDERVLRAITTNYRLAKECKRITRNYMDVSNTLHRLYNLTKDRRYLQDELGVYQEMERERLQDQMRGNEYFNYWMGYAACLEILEPTSTDWIGKYKNVFSIPDEDWKKSTEMLLARVAYASKLDDASQFTAAYQAYGELLNFTAQLLQEGGIKIGEDGLVSGTQTRIGTLFHLWLIALEHASGGRANTENGYRDGFKAKTLLKEPLKTYHNRLNAFTDRYIPKSVSQSDARLADCLRRSRFYLR